MTYELSAWPSLPPNWGAEVLGCLGRPAWFPLYRIRYDKQPDGMPDPLREKHPERSTGDQRACRRGATKIICRFQWRGSVITIGRSAMEERVLAPRPSLHPTS